MVNGEKVILGGISNATGAVLGKDAGKFVDNVGSTVINGLDTAGKDVVNTIANTPQNIVKTAEDIGTGVKDLFTGKLFGLSEIEGVQADGGLDAALY